MNNLSEILRTMRERIREFLAEVEASKEDIDRAYEEARKAENAEFWSDKQEDNF